MLKEFLVTHSLFRNRLHLLEQRKKLYATALPDQKKTDQQIERFNTVWRYCYNNLPFYRMWKKMHQLPDQILNIDELSKFPELTKAVLQEHQDLVFPNGKVSSYIETGGSTGEPVRFPTSSADAENAYATMYCGRSWSGVEPLAPCLAFWGHSHLFGKGFSGRMASRKRSFLDRLLNISRLNAYDMAPQTLNIYSKSLQLLDPVWMIGYTSCLYKLAKYLKDNQIELPKNTRLRAVVATAESITDADITLMQEVYSAPVVIEYGMAETGVIAYSSNTTREIRIFWDQLICIMCPDNTLNVTTISDKSFPLINYRTEDVIEVSHELYGSIFELSSIEGRKKDILTVDTESGSSLKLSGIFFVHVLKSYPGILSIQFEQLEEKRVRVDLVGIGPLNLQHVEAYFHSEISKDHPNISRDAVIFQQIDKSRLTVAGKERLVC